MSFVQSSSLDLKTIIFINRCLLLAQILQNFLEEYNNQTKMCQNNPPQIVYIQYSPVYNDFNYSTNVYTYPGVTQSYKHSGLQPFLLVPGPQYFSAIGISTQNQNYQQIHQNESLNSQVLPLESQIEQQTVPKRTIAQNIKIKVTSAKKNSEHNIMSQFGSLFSRRSKTQKIVRKIVVSMNISPTEEVIKTIFNVVSQIVRSRRKKYVSFQFFQKISHPIQYQKVLPELNTAFQKDSPLSLQQFCKIFRIALAYFLKNIAHHCILTSRRLKSIARQCHLQRARHLLKELTAK